MKTAAQRNLDAEVRFVEEGHRARLDNGSILVTSDTHHGKAYRVTGTAPWAGHPVTFTCTPEGTQAYSDDHLACTSPEPGIAPCKHAAGAARRLEREGLAELHDGYWVATHKAQRLATPKPTTAGLYGDPDGDPFDGLGTHEGHVA